MSAKYITLLFTFFSIFTYSPHITAESIFDKTLNSAVGNDYQNGLHAKYLHYIAIKLSANIDLSPMPYARRIKELEKGTLDIMVGLQCNDKNSDNLHYVIPPYESLSYEIYTLKSEHPKFKVFDDLFGSIISVNQSGRFFPKFDHNTKIKKVKALNLTQKIRMLLANHVDAFVHLPQVADLKIEQLGLSDKIVKTQYQNSYKNDYCITLSRNSPLKIDKNELSRIVQLGVEQRDFQKIRGQHYKVKHEHKPK